MRTAARAVQADREDWAAKQIRIALVGLSASGGWASRSHFPALSSLPEYTVSAVLGSSAEASRRAAEKYAIPSAFGDIAELAESDEFDLAVVAVRVPHHVELVAPLVDAGRAVYCEWPLAVTTAEAEDLESRARGTRSYVGLQGRSLPMVKYLSDLVREGAIGRILSTTLIASGMSWGAETYRSSQYLRDDASGASVLTIPFGHALDVLETVLGPVSDVNADLALRRPQVYLRDAGEMITATAHDHLSLNATLGEGVQATVHYRGGSVAGSNLLCSIVGAEGEIAISGANGHVQHGQFSVEAALNGAKTLSPLQVPKSYEMAPELLHREDQAHAVGNAYRQLLSDSRGRTERAPGFAHGLRLHRLLDAVRESSASGRRIDVRHLAVEGKSSNGATT